MISDLYHSHIHTIFRVAEETSDSPNLYSLWTGSSVTPSLESELTADYFSVSNTEKHVYKSAIVECVWHRVTEVSQLYFYKTYARFTSRHVHVSDLSVLLF